MNEELISRVGDIAATLRSHCEENERAGRLATPVVDALRRIGATRLFAPRALGGEEADPVTISRITEELARLDPAAAWFVMVANSSRLLGARFPEPMFDALWGEDIDTIVAASGNRPFTGAAVPGGYCLNGTNAFVSGCHHADWLLSPFFCDGTVRFAVMPMAALEIVDNWHVLGMRGTGSNDVRANDVFVPDAMTGVADGASLNSYHQGALYRCPGRVIFSTYVPVTLALADRALQLVQDLARSKVPYASASPLRERSLAQVKFGRALGTYRAARAYYYSAMEAVWAQAQAGQVATDDDRADLYLAGTYAVQACADTTRLLQDIVASSATYDASPLQGIFRDMEVLRHHGFANESRFGNVAQIKWGAALDYPLMLR